MPALTPEIWPRAPAEGLDVVHFHQTESGLIHRSEPAVRFEQLNTVAGIVEDAAAERRRLGELALGRRCRCFGEDAFARLVVECDPALLKASTHDGRCDDEHGRDEQADESQADEAAACQLGLDGALLEQRRLGPLHLGHDEADLVHGPPASVGG